MAITKQDAVNSHYGQEFHQHGSEKVYTVRVNGKCQTWKRSPERFRLPVKYGLSMCLEINERNASVYWPGSGRQCDGKHR